MSGPSQETPGGYVTLSCLLVQYRPTDDSLGVAVAFGDERECTLSFQMVSRYSRGGVIALDEIDRRAADERRRPARWLPRAVTTAMGVRTVVRIGLFALEHHDINCINAYSTASADGRSGGITLAEAVKCGVFRQNVEIYKILWRVMTA